MAKKNTGKLFEEEVQTSCNEQKIWFFRVRDVSIPPDLRMRVRVPENPYDSLIHKNGYLFPTELKSTKGKSLPFKNIKDHQVESLIESNTYDDTIIPGFLINFSEEERSFFLHIDDYIKYVGCAVDGEKLCEGRKVNESSLSLDYCEGVATEITGVKKRTKHRWYIGKLLDELIEKYSES